MNILILGDVFGPPGMKAVTQKLPSLIKKKEVDFVIIEFNKDFKRVVASHSHIFKNKEAKSLTNTKTKVKKSATKNSKLGDIEELANLKEKLDGKN